MSRKFKYCEILQKLLVRLSCVTAGTALSVSQVFAYCCEPLVFESIGKEDFYSYQSNCSQWFSKNDELIPYELTSVKLSNLEIIQTSQDEYLFVHKQFGCIGPLPLGSQATFDGIYEHENQKLTIVSGSINGILFEVTFGENYFQYSINDGK